MTSISIKNQGGLRVFSLVRGVSEIKCLRTIGLCYNHWRRYCAIKLQEAVGITNRLLSLR
jgi:hypothetical protein